MTPDWSYYIKYPLRNRMMSTANIRRLTTRITDHVEERLQMAADLVGATINQFVVQAALEKADRVIESESAIVLTRRESLRLLDLIENPPPRNAKFLEAQRRYLEGRQVADPTPE